MMLNVLKNWFGGAGAIKDVAEIFTPNAEKSEQRGADERMALMKAYETEFTARQGRTWLDSLVDSFNRIIRPTIATVVLVGLALAFFDPDGFLRISRALTSVPDGYWALLSLIVAFYFGGRMQLKSQDFQFKTAQAQAVSELLQKRAEFRKLEMDDDEPDRLVGDGKAKHADVENHHTRQRNKIAVAFRKARAGNQPLSSDLTKAKAKLAAESGGQVETVWPDELFEGG